jgi:hypothetical protein
MDKTTNQIESDIERKRDELGANLNELEHKVKQIGDWRHHFDNHPMTLIGAAFGGGMLLATMLGRSRRDAPTYSGSSPRKHKALDTWDHIKDALIGVAATRVTDFVGELVPGFAEEFRTRTRSTESPTAVHYSG